MVCKNVIIDLYMNNFNANLKNTIIVQIDSQRGSFYYYSQEKYSHHPSSLKTSTKNTIFVKTYACDIFTNILFEIKLEAYFLLEKK